MSNFEDLVDDQSYKTEQPRKRRIRRSNQARDQIESNLDNGSQENLKTEERVEENLDPVDAKMNELKS
jgi:hypothetical protein